MLLTVADENIPHVGQAFGSIGDVCVLNAESITDKVCANADILLVRSVTRVDQSLLSQSRVRFVGSATAGFDHIDQAYLRKRGIQFTHAAGSNADSVVEYVLAALIQLSALERHPLAGLTLGIVGCGNIGSRLAVRASAFGLHILKNDPPLANAGHAGFVDLETILAESDIITLHVPGSSDTCHLIGKSALQSMNPGVWLMNTSRGSVIDSIALSEVLDTGRIGATVLDVWENEPTPDLELLQKVTLGTPHIAGHSMDGKLQGTVMLYRAITDYFRIQPSWDFERILQQDLPPPISVNPDPSSTWLNRIVRRLYDIRADDTRMRMLLSTSHDQVAGQFRRLRRNYPSRRAFDRHQVTGIPSSVLGTVRDGLRVVCQ
ncbi:MAG: 4-phosphoerythronate dehydrogenase [Rhodothermaceae bacterium]|nr:4-phosphoerythronate dehydrogenase [Rhodothermaceae bacterium]MYF63407.1 4-phosphoerythronate dehydrogenase [Rhodothermaceae bacterium]MYI84691.1 4-phosphoerythronate dehydrogenase [Rhodothermaceae bacterium]